MALHLILRLEGPLMAFGGETIDNLGVIRDFPARSMLTGLIANALGWRREDAAAHDRLQSRLIFGARLDRPGIRFTEFQTAELRKDDAGWTTTGTPEPRGGGDGTYKGQHLRYRDHLADAAVLIALRLEPADESPTLQDVAQALQRPMRPLFLGRKPCIPSGPLFVGFIDATDVLAALTQASPLVPNPLVRAQWPAGEGDLPGSRRIDLCDERNWTSGVHGGWRPVCQGSLPLETPA
jgi:CRISPR system Cascade subunit CasD